MAVPTSEEGMMASGAGEQAQSWLYHQPFKKATTNPRDLARVQNGLCFYHPLEAWRGSKQVHRPLCLRKLECQGWLKAVAPGQLGYFTDQLIDTWRGFLPLSTFLVFASFRTSLVRTD
jgi:hypothetical protein